MTANKSNLSEKDATIKEISDILKRRFPFDFDDFIVNKVDKPQFVHVIWEISGDPFFKEVVSSILHEEFGEEFRHLVKLDQVIDKEEVDKILAAYDVSCYVPEKRPVYKEVSFKSDDGKKEISGFLLDVGKGPWCNRTNTFLD